MNEICIGTLWCYEKKRWEKRQNPTWKYIGEVEDPSMIFPENTIDEPHLEDIK